MLRRGVLAVVMAIGLTTVLSATNEDLRLVNAAMQGDIEGVRSLLQEKVDVNAAEGDGMTALHWAAYKNDLPIAEMLIKAGARVRAATRVESIQPLFMAATNANPAMIELLVKAGADVNTGNALGTTPLMQAAAAGNVDAVRVLLESGADINAADKIREQTALMFAAAKNRDGVIKLLASKHVNLNATSKVVPLEKPLFDDDGNPIVPRAGIEERSSEAKFMGGFSALHYAAREGHMNAVRALVESGADVNLVNPGDKTSIMVEAIINGQYDIARYLLDKGADPNLASIDGLAALYATIDNEYAPVAWSATSHTWSDGTAQQKTSYLALMKAILEKSGDPNARISRPLWFRPPHHNQMWVTTGGSTAFWRAAQATDVHAMKLLVAHGADPKIPSLANDTALAMAAGIGWTGNYSINAPGFLESVKYLVEEIGIDVNTVDVDGYTPVMGAAYRGDNEMVKYLVSKGAKLDVRTKRGWSVTDMTTAPNLRSSVGLAHPDTEALLMTLGAPPRLAIDDEEVLGIIKRTIPVPTIPKKKQ